MHSLYRLDSCRKRAVDGGAGCMLDEGFSEGAIKPGCAADEKRST